LWRRPNFFNLRGHVARNIMLEEDDTAIFTDFDSCFPKSHRSGRNPVFQTNAKVKLLSHYLKVIGLANEILRTERMRVSTYSGDLIE
jgi:hypothetical protein